MIVLKTKLGGNPAQFALIDDALMMRLERLSSFATNVCATGWITKEWGNTTSSSSVLCWQRNLNGLVNSTQWPDRQVLNALGLLSNGSTTIAKPTSQERRAFPSSRKTDARWNIKPLGGSSLKTGSISPSPMASRLEPFC